MKMGAQPPLNKPIWRWLVFGKPSGPGLDTLNPWSMGHATFILKTPWVRNSELGIAWGENSASNQFPKDVSMESMECTSRRLCYPGATTEVPHKVGDGWDESQAGQLGDQEGIARVRFLTARRI